MFLLAAIFLPGMFALVPAPDSLGHAQHRLMDYLFSDYKKEVRPMCESAAPLEVKVGMAVRQIIDMNEPNQILSLNAWIRLSWHDCHLVWDSSHFSNLSSLVVPVTDIWRPDITMYDNADGSGLPGQHDSRVALTNTGIINYNYPTVIRVFCKIDVTYFPFDKQICPVAFSSWSYNGLQLNVTSMSTEGDLTSFVTNVEWDLIAVPVETRVTYFGSSPYPEVIFFLEMHHKPTFYMANLVLPCAIISTVSLFGFMIPADAGEKISLEITVLLSLAVFLLVVSEHVPASSESFPFLGMYFLVTMLLVALSTLFTVLVLNIHHKGEQKKKVPAWLDRLCYHYVAPMVRYRHTLPDVPGLEPNHPNGEGRHDAKMGEAKPLTTQQPYHVNSDPREAQCNGSRKVSQAIIRPQGSTSNYRSGETTPTQSQPRHHTDDLNVSHSGVTPLKNQAGPPTPDDVTSLACIMTQQLWLLERSEARARGRDQQDDVTEQWRRVALVADRFFMAVFVLVLLTSSVTIVLRLVLNR